MNLYDHLPSAIKVNGEEYPIETDFRVWIKFYQLISGNQSDKEKAGGLEELLKNQGLPPSKLSAESVLDFFVCGAKIGSENKSGKESRSPSFDFDVDSAYIFADFLRFYGIDLSKDELHWWQFMAMFKALPDESKIKTIIGYRTVSLSKVPKSQRQNYAKLKSIYRLKNGSDIDGNSAEERERNLREYVKKRFEEAAEKKKVDMPVLRSDKQPSVD